MTAFRARMTTFKMPNSAALKGRRRPFTLWKSCGSGASSSGVSGCFFWWSSVVLSLVFDANLWSFAAGSRSGYDFEGAHHVVGFVFEDVAVVEVFAGVAFEANDDARYGACRALNGVFPTKFVGCWRLRRCNKAHFFGGHVLEGIESAAVEDLEAHEMNVHGVRVLGLVNQLPDLGGIEFGELGGGFVPVLVVDEHDHRILEAVLMLIEGDGAGGDGGGLGGALDGAQGPGEGDGWAG